MNDPGPPDPRPRPDPTDSMRARASAQPGPAATLRHGGLRFVSEEHREVARERLARARILVVELDPIEPGSQGKLGALVYEAIERALAKGGAAAEGLAPVLGRNGPPSLGHAGSATATDGAEPDASLGDQLYRSRTIGATGIAIFLGRLRTVAEAGATDDAGVLLPSDSAVLRFLCAAARERPVFVILDAADAKIGGYDAPVALERLLVPLSSSPLASRSPDIAAPVAPRPQSPSTDVAAIAPAAVSPDRPSPTASPTASLWPGSPSLWAQHLTAARGPQPLAALERMFCESYVPLDLALAAGLDDPRARAAHDEFRSTFIRSYTDAFATFAATTKRPRMVLDAHEVAGRIARLHGARSVRLLLVDAMRWDIGRLIQDRLTARLGSRAALADEVLLWSALPTVTMRQLETLARGVEALRSPSELDPDAEPVRGRTAEYVRRLRVGPREIHKLDVVETRLHAARGAVLRAMPEIADEAADVIARQADGLAPHTLLFVFGDHGFTLDRHGSAQQGGASPEEVLVGAFALLVGDVH